MVKFLQALFVSDNFYNKLRLNDYLENLFKNVACFIELNKTNTLNDNYLQEMENKDILLKLFQSIETINQNTFDIKIYNLVSLNDLDNNNLQFYEGKIIKLKVHLDTNDIFNYKTNNDLFEINNIAFYKGETIFNISSIILYLNNHNIKIPNENNDIIVEFANLLKENKTNLFFFIGSSCSSDIKTILNSFGIACIEWLNWSNFEVF
jgi:hypothetical protein